MPSASLRAKVQYANIRQNAVRDEQPEFRAILDYTVLFRGP
jgi:hypothetical protein